MSVVNIFPTTKAVVQIRIMTKAIKDNSYLITIYTVGVLWPFKFWRVHLRSEYPRSSCWEDQMRPELSHRLTPQQWDLLSQHWVGAGTSPTQDLPTPEADMIHSQSSRPCSLLFRHSSCGQTAQTLRICSAWTERGGTQLPGRHPGHALSFGIPMMQDCPVWTLARDAVGLLCHKGTMLAYVQ